MSKNIQKFIIFSLVLYFGWNFLSASATTSGRVVVNFPAKERTLTSAINKKPSDTEASIRLIKHYLDSDQDTKAMIELNRIKSRVSGNPKFYIMTANLLYKKGLFNEAEEMAKKAVKISYNNPEAFVLLGNINFDKANLLENKHENLELRKNFMTKAFDNFYTACKYNSESPFPHIGLAKLYYLNGQNNFALDEILKAKELGINNPDALYALGEYYYKTKEYEKSKTFLEKSLSVGLTSKYKTFYMLGTIYEQDGSIEKAQQNYLKTLKLKPDNQEAQQNLDRLIKVSYKEAETLSNKQKTTTDLFSNLNDELNIVMQADYYLVIDEFTRARDLYIKVLDKNNDNINAVTGLAELYYAKWVEGFTNSADFVNDSKYIMKIKESPRIVIPLIKFKLINEETMPEAIRQRFINLSISETFDFYDLLNEVRAEFLLGNFEESHDKLQKLLSFKLSNYEKFKVLKSLCYDHDNDEALILIDELKKTYYHNEELAPIATRIKTKYSVADEKLNQAIALYNTKDSKQADFVGAEYIIKQAIRYFPTHKKAYLHYAYLLEKQKKYKEALAKATICSRLYKLYPDKTFEISDADLKKFIQNLKQKIAQT